MYDIPVFKSLPSIFLNNEIINTNKLENISITDIYEKEPFNNKYYLKYINILFLLIIILIIFNFYIFYIIKMNNL